ncbi:DNA primase catalytic subunit PriS, partial [Candidatus Micrarchaeota archaeon]|nr:DNA primase catalytic subunit PriS [Candidatus Micrarchaeota archaeon]
FYKKNRISVDSIFQREFGVGIDKKINYRHKSFSNENEFHNFLTGETPRFVSYSVGRFEFPWARPMERKNLLSADLVFDLDALPEQGHNPVFCSSCVERAKRDTLRLVEGFLLPVFGLSAGDFQVVYSGSKGFHVHVATPAVQDLSSTARRLLVDCITGRELSSGALMHKQRIESSQAYSLVGPDKAATGWRGRFYEEVLSSLQTNRLPQKKAAYLAENKARVFDLLAEGNWSFFHGLGAFLEEELKRTIDKHGVQVDSPVTFDVHRLIRVPRTLHGDTGFQAKPLSLADLDSFDASKHASVFKGKTSVQLKQDVSVYFNGEDFELKQGQNEVPLSLAILFACKGTAL